MAKVLTVRIDSTLEKSIAKFARARGWTESQAVRELLREALDTTTPDIATRNRQALETLKAVKAAIKGAF